MTPKRKKRLYLVLFILFAAGGVVALATYALQQNINLFYSPIQIAAGEAPKNTRIRAGGMVVDGSVVRDTQSLKITFEITDYKKTVPVSFEGILPDLFREGQGVVAQGELNQDGVFVADEVLAKHDEQYMPPEVEQALKEANSANQAVGEEQ